MEERGDEMEIGEAILESLSVDLKCLGVGRGGWRTWTKVMSVAKG